MGYLSGQWLNASRKLSRFNGFSPTVAAAWIAVASYGAFRGLTEVNTHPSLFDVVEPQYRSTAEGLMNLVVFLVGSTAPLLMGALSDRYGVRGFETGFAILDAVYVLGGLSMLASVRFFFARHRVEER